MKRILPAAVLALLVAADARADTPVETGVVLTALQDELARATAMQLNGMQKPYYAAFEVRDVDALSVTASLGTVVEDNVSRRRHLDSRVRVGDYANDSGNLEDDTPWRHRDRSSRLTSLDDRYDGVRHDAWLSIDDSYKSALAAFSKKTAIRAGQETAPERVDDFSREPKTVLVDARPPKVLDREKATRMARALSAVGVDFPALQGASASIRVHGERAYFASSEGTRVVEPRVGVMVQSVFRAQADDGMQLSTYRSVATCSADTVPSEESLVAEARQAATELDEIRRAPVVDDYSGPILFEGVAASQLLYNVVAYSLLGTPPPVSSGRSFRSHPESELVGQIGQRVMPAGFRIEDDPTIDRFAGLPLAGCYKVDDEGVPAQKVTLVDDGIFKSFLMSRTPRKGLLHSNGHGRESYDGITASIGNLNLVAAKGLSAKDLRARLIAEAKAQRRPYALVVERLADRSVHDVDATRSESISSRARSGGTKVLVMWKLGLDGKATRVRGGELGSIPLRTLKDIVAAGSVPAVHGYGGRGGYSVTSPALLFKDLEVKKPRDPAKRPPVLPRPN